MKILNDCEKYCERMRKILKSLNNDKKYTILEKKHKILERISYNKNTFENLEEIKNLSEFNCF